MSSDFTRKKIELLSNLIGAVLKDTNPHHNGRLSTEMYSMVYDLVAIDQHAICPTLLPEHNKINNKYGIMGENSGPIFQNNEKPFEWGPQERGPVALKHNNRRATGMNAADIEHLENFAENIENMTYKDGINETVVNGRINQNEYAKQRTQTHGMESARRPGNDSIRHLSDHTIDDMVKLEAEKSASNNRDRDTLDNMLSDHGSIRPITDLALVKPLMDAWGISDDFTDQSHNNINEVVANYISNDVAHRLPEICPAHGYTQQTHWTHDNLGFYRKTPCTTAQLQPDPTICHTLEEQTQKINKICGSNTNYVNTAVNSSTVNQLKCITDQLSVLTQLMQDNPDKSYGQLVDTLMSRMGDPPIVEHKCLDPNSDHLAENIIPSRSENDKNSLQLDQKRDDIVMQQQPAESQMHPENDLSLELTLMRRELEAAGGHFADSYSEESSYEICSSEEESDAAEASQQVRPILPLGALATMSQSTFGASY